MISKLQIWALLFVCVFFSYLFLCLSVYLLIQSHVFSGVCVIDTLHQAVNVMLRHYEWTLGCQKCVCGVCVCVVVACV